MADPSASPIAIYQLRVLLCGVSPLVPATDPGEQAILAFNEEVQA
jgi:hypothetical protein